MTCGDGGEAGITRVARKRPGAGACPAGCLARLYSVSRRKRMVRGNLGLDGVCPGHQVAATGAETSGRHVGASTIASVPASSGEAVLFDSADDPSSQNFRQLTRPASGSWLGSPTCHPCREWSSGFA